MTDGWVTPNQQLIGGHLFKAEFGLVEADYKKAADQDAATAAKTNTAFTAMVKTKATFADRPDLLVSDDDLKKAGWPDVDPGRELRKKKYTEVAENFSGIPTAVSVSVTGLTSGTNYVIPARCKRNATETRQLVRVSN